MRATALPTICQIRPPPSTAKHHSLDGAVLFAMRCALQGRQAERCGSPSPRHEWPSGPGLTT